MMNLLQRLRISTKLWLLLGVFAMIGLVDNVTELALINQRLHVEKEIQLRHLVETAHSILKSYEQAGRAGRMPDDAARQLAIQSIRELRYGGREYFWIHDQGAPIPKMIMHPTVPALDGTVLDAERFNRATSWRSGDGDRYQALPVGSNLFVAMNRAIGRTGDGFVTYDWPKPFSGGGVSEQAFPKLSYVKQFQAWGWVIGSGIYIDDLQAEYWLDAQSRLVKALLWLILMGLVIWFVMRTIVRPLESFQQTIDTLRANPLALPTVPPQTTQSGELGQLTASFVGLMEDLQRSRNELTFSIDRLRQTARSFTAMPEGILITDPAGLVLSLNPAFGRLTGYDPDELVGQNISTLRSDRHDAAYYAELWARLQTDGQWSGTLWNRLKDGRVRPHWVCLMAARDPTGQVQFYLGVYTDVTVSAHR